MSGADGKKTDTQHKRPLINHVQPVTAPGRKYGRIITHRVSPRTGRVINVHDVHVMSTLITFVFIEINKCICTVFNTEKEGEKINLDILQLIK